jgi:hypothetical protein
MRSSRCVYARVSTVRRFAGVVPIEATVAPVPVTCAYRRKRDGGSLRASLLVSVMLAG